MSKGQIIKALSGFYYVASEGVTYQTRGRGNFRNRQITPLVGDYVEFESTNLTDGYVLDILPRKNELVRPQVANIDQAVVVTSCVEPNFSFNLLDRFLVTLEEKYITPVIYVTKLDLANDAIKQAMVDMREAYTDMGYQVLFSQTTDLAELKSLFMNRLTVFMGQSGAGKSTLLNELVPDLNLAVGDISVALGRGKHTTRHVELIPISGGLVADTPGFSSIDFLEMDTTELPKCFPDFLAVADNCKFRECQHRKEPKCAVKAGVADEMILDSRYNNYLQFYDEIANRKPIYRKK
ncbi:ribosome small subunit-dependent GTPase A [Vagococcus penaei]|uniref:Small ribosomal subunit biogenesis GTPase RsgA n=1 Tax=Vagococcus penaei TaxID=633807 RepID=A0A1Q2D6X0_9ENTE|nr:ribosome small subunit-dependent GTPase A [Vagococcus penaei]AQP54063.1 ribosome small subunit-dependent GTPase A [Vagococcus penaei]RSU01704.1 ribosome small subunit-dependent GTPase A [Vagococcus penaei]